MNRNSRGVMARGVMAGLIFAAAAAIGGFAWWLHLERTRPGGDQAATTAAAESPPGPAASAADDAASQIKYPLETPAGLPPLPPGDRAEAYVNERLIDLLGRPAVLTMLSGPPVVAHFVATIDNLPRESASSRLWPVNPAPDRLRIEQADGRTVLSAKNAERYAPLVNLLETLDLHSTVALYRHMYPLFQHEYEQLGYPGKYFNDRLVAVIDHLLAAPEPAGPLELTLTEVKGPIASTRPWVRYEFADPALESRSAGQKILMRMGLDQERRLKLRLRELRAQLVQGTSAQ